MPVPLFTTSALNLASTYAATDSAAVAVASAGMAWWFSRSNIRNLEKQLATQTKQLVLQNEHLGVQNDQLKIQSEQLIIQNREFKLSLYASLTANVFEVNRILMNHPELRKYFYEGALVTNDDPIELVATVAEFILDFFSVLQEHNRFLQGDHLPSYDQWVRYIQDLFRSSPFLCVQLSTNMDWYESGLIRLFDEVRGEVLDKMAAQSAALA